VQFSPDGKLVVPASADKIAKVRDVNTEQEVITLTGHDHFVVSAAYSPDGKRVLTSNSNKTTRLYATDINELIWPWQAKPNGPS